MFFVETLDVLLDKGYRHFGQMQKFISAVTISIPRKRPLEFLWGMGFNRGESSLAEEPN